MTTTWVLLRGLTREARHWGDFADVFAARFAGDAVVAPDLPGNGRLSRQRSPATVAGLLAHARAQLIAQGHPPPYGLLAMSLGAMVALEWATAWPGEVRGAVLVNTSVGGLAPWHCRLRPSSAARLAWLLVSGAPGDAWEAAILQLTTNHPPAPQALLRRWQALRRECPVSRGNALRQLWSAARFRAAAAPPAAPLLLLASTRDRLVDVRCSRALAAHVVAPSVEHPTAGHDLPVDAPAWVAAQVARWWSDVGRAPLR